MKVNGKSKTPITAAQTKKNSGETGGNKARTSQQTSKRKLNRVIPAVLERISDGILAFDAGMNYTYLNERAGELLGRSAEELIGKNLREEYSSADHTPFIEACQRALETQSVVWLNEYFPTTDLWLEGRVYPSEDGVSVLFSEGARQKPLDVEDRYRLLVESMREAFFLADVLTDEHGQPRDYRFLDVNAAMEQLLNKNRTQIIGKTVRELLSLTARDIELVKRIAAVGLGSESFFVDQYSESMQRWFRSHFFSPRPGQVSGMSLDVSDSKQAEERNREISMFPEQNPNPVMRLSRDGEVLYANQASAPLLTVWEQTREPAVSFLRIKEQLPEALNTGSNREVEIENQGKVFTSLLVPIAGQDYVNLYFRDITERKQAEGTLQAIVNQASAGIIRTDMRGRYTFVNQAFCDMLGYSEQELRGMSIWDVVDGETREKNSRLFEHMLSSGEGYQVEQRMMRHNGSTVWASVGTSPLRDTDGRVTGATAVIVDITRRKRVEESLLDTARRSLFLSSLSDTLRSFDTPAKIEVEAACLLGAHLQASRVALAQVDFEGRFQVKGGYVDEVPQLEGVFSISDFVPREQLAKLQAGRLFTMQDVKKDARFTASQRSRLEKLAIRAQMILPFIGDNRVTAILLIQQDQPRKWGDEDVSLVEDAAERLQAASERARAEDRLRDSERRYRILANAVPSIVWTSTPDGRLLYVNDRWYDFTGLPRQEETPHWGDLKLHPEDAPNFFQQMRAIKNSQAEAVVEVRIQRQDDTYRWFQTRAVPTLDENGNITAWHGVLTDIHDRVEKDAEQRKIIDSTPFMLTRCSRDLRYQFVSRAYAEMIGMTPRQVVGRSIVEVMGEKGLKAILAYVERVLNGERVEYEDAVPFATGKTPYLHVTYTPDRDEQGNVVGWFASIIDITERRQMEENLRESEHKFNIIFHKLPFTALLLQPEDNVIVDANEEFETVFGFTRQEAIGRTTSALGIESNPESLARILEELQANVAIRDMELQFNTKLHGLRTFLINTDMVNIGGSDYILQTAQDITERKRIEQDLARERELLERLFETMPVMVSMYDPVTKTVRVNAEFERVVGWKAEELSVSSIRETLYPNPEYRKDVLDRMAKAGRKDWVEVRVQKRDGSSMDSLWANISILKDDQLVMGIALGIDITERKRAEVAIRASEERMRLAIESNRMVAWEWDTQADRVTTSENLAEVYGLSSVGTLTEGFALIWPEDLPAHRAKVERIVRTGGEYRSEFRITRPVDGQTLWMEERAIAMTDDSGKVHRLVGIVIDITERKRTEQELAEFARQQQALYRLADELSSAGSLEEMFNPALDAIQNALQCDRASILLFDDQGVMSFVAWRGLSDAYRRATNGHSPWTSAEKNARPITLNDIAMAGLSDVLRAAIQAEGIGALAFIPLISRGNLIGKFMVYYNIPHIFEEKDVELAQTIAHQLASHIERKRAEEELRQSKQRLSLTYHHAPIGIVETTMDGHFLEVNDELCKMLGYSYEELIQLGIAEITHKSDLAPEMELHHQLVTGAIPFYRMEKRFIKKDGSLLWGEIVRTILHDENGNAMYGIGGILNIDERKRRELELHDRKEEIEALMEVSPIGIFVAHDPECSRITANPAGYHLVEMPEDSTGNLSRSVPEHERPTYRTFRNGVELKPEDLPMQTAARLGMEVEEETLELRFENGVQKYIYAYAKPLFDPQGKVRGAIASMLDITQRMQKEEEIRARTEEIGTLMELSPIGIMVAHDPQCNQITGNPAANVILGLPESAAENLSNPALAERGPAHRVYRDGEELAVPDLPMQTAARMGIEVKDETLELRFEGGARKYIYLYAKPLFDAQNRTRGAVAAMLDVTERRRNEQALRESEERFSKAFRASPDAVTISRMSDGYILEINNSWSSLFGYEAEDAIGKTSQELNLFTDWQARERAVIQLLQQGSVRDFEIDVRRKSGEIRHALLAVERIEINGVECLISIMRDITERKQAEMALRQSEERFAQFMQHFPGHAWIKDLQGRYVYANAAVFKTYNLSPDELYGKRDQEIFSQEVAAQFVSTDEMALGEEKGTQMVQQSQQDDHTIGHSLITKFPILGPDGRAALVGGTAIDITERVQMENALRTARVQAEKTAYRMTQLQKITAALSQTITTSEIARMVVNQAISILGAAGGSIMLLDEERQNLEMVYSSLEEAVTRPYQQVPLSLELPNAEAVRSGQPVWIESLQEYQRHYPRLAEQIQSWGLEAGVSIPMVYKGYILGTVSLSFNRPVPFSSEDQEYLLTLARQAAQAFERARVETALRLDAAMMENVPAGIYLVRARDGMILHTNPQLDKLFGYEPGEVIGKPVWVLNAENLRSPQEVAEEITSALRRESSWQGEVLSRRKDGTTFWCYASVTTFEHDIHGTVWVAARQDITERKQIEAALRESEQRYRAIVSQATAGIVRKDESGRLLFVNQAFCDMLGMAESELTGRRIWELTHEDDVWENKRLYDRLMADGIPFQFEKRLIRRNGSVLWTNVSVSPVMDSQGRTNSAVSVYVDITGAKQAEGRLALLTTVSELARDLEDPEELMFAVSRVVGEHFQVRRALFNEIDLEHDREIVHRDYCRGVESVAGTHRISAYSNITTAEMMAGKTVINQDSKIDPRTAADYERSYVRYGERAYVTIPLMREDRWVASLWISDDQPRDWEKEDVDLLEGIAERTWTAAEKLRVDQALQDSEERLRVTFNTTAVGFATLRPDTHFMEVNEAYCRIVGYSREELLQMDYSSLVHPRFSEETTQLLAQLLAGEVASFIIEKIFVRRDGTEIWVQNSLSLVRDAAGTPLHLIAICQDVTERKRAEDALHEMNVELEERVKRRTSELQVANEFLRESEATSRLILESMPDAIVIIDRDGHIVHANTQVETLFGYTPGEVMGRPVETLIPQRFRTQHEQQRFSYGEERDRRIMGLGQELYGQRKDETEFPVEVMLASIDNSTNWDVLVAIRDNTRQRQAQEALRNNEEKLRTLFELLPVGVSFINKEGKVSELNSALAEILDMPRSQILSGKYQSRRFIHADGAPMPAAEFASTRALVEKKTVYNVETGIVKENGEIIWTSVNAAPVQVADIEAAIVTIDITERKKAEEALHKNRERLRVLSRRLVEVQEEERHAIARELHDRVGQNLAALTLNLNILRNQLSGEVLDKVGTRLNDSVTLVKDILTITRSVMADLRPNVLDDYGLDAAINEYAERFTQRYGIRVITHTPVKATPRLDPGIEMTLLRIVQEALTNIARHAQATQAVMTLELEDDEVRMAVEDNGQGIMSWQKVNQPGSHGLRIMRERAEAFGGSLKVNSTYKNGTKVEVKIPLTSSVPANGRGRKEKK
jgi:PAS domain S-box-containing protein